MSRMHSRDIHKWRAYFKSSNSSIFDVIENAILVATLDHLYEFKFQKELTAFKLLACRLLKCSFCKGEMSSSSRSLACASAKESRVNCSNNSLDVEEKQKDDSNRMLENLAMEIEEDNETLQETLKVKKVLGNSHTQSDLVIEELLQKLHRMDLSIQILKATMIGSTVTTLRKHGSKQIREQARDLIWKWRKVADEWIAQDTNSCVLPQPQQQEEDLNINSIETGSEELRCTHLNNSLSNGENPTNLECTPTNISEKLFEGVDEKKFFSILPHDDAFTTMEDLYIKQDSHERLKTTEKEKEVKLINTKKRTQPNNSTNVGKTKASECDKEGRSVVVTQNQLKQKTIDRPTSVNSQKKTTILGIGDLGKRVKSDKNSQLKRNINNKPQVGSALKANEGIKVDQNPPRSSSYAGHVVLALPAQPYIGTRKPKSNPNKRAKLSQSGDIHEQKLKAKMEVDELKVEQARKRLIAGYEQLESGKKRRAVKVIDPKEVKDVKGKQGNKNLFH